jgi:pimeloyl-ACP methyl ester carboxylesterase
VADLVVRGLHFNVVQMGPGDEPPADDPYAGHRLPVVFLHGLIMDNLASFFYTVAPAVARVTDVVLYDLRGHGRTERPLDGYRIEDGVDDLIGVLDAVGIDGPVHLVANSFGGTIALAAALRRPDRIAGMVLIEAHPAFEGWGDEMIEDLQDLVEGFDGPGIRDYLASGAPRSLKTMVRTCEELVTESSLGDDLRRSEPTRPEDLATLSCPSVLLYGESSDILDRAFVLEDSIPGTVLEVVDACSHALLMENPAEVERLTLAWLDQQAEQRADDAARAARAGQVAAG